MTKHRTHRYAKRVSPRDRGPRVSLPQCVLILKCVCDCQCLNVLQETVGLSELSCGSFTWVEFPDCSVHSLRFTALECSPLGGRGSPPPAPTTSQCRGPHLGLCLTHPMWGRQQPFCSWSSLGLPGTCPGPAWPSTFPGRQLCEPGEGSAAWMEPARAGDAMGGVSHSSGRHLCRVTLGPGPLCSPLWASQSAERRHMSSRTQSW